MYIGKVYDNHNNCEKYGYLNVGNSYGDVTSEFNNYISDIINGRRDRTYVKYTKSKQRLIKKDWDGEECGYLIANDFQMCLIHHRLYHCKDNFNFIDYEAYVNDVFGRLCDIDVCEHDFMEIESGIYAVRYMNYCSKCYGMVSNLKNIDKIVGMKEFIER